MQSHSAAYSDDGNYRSSIVVIKRTSGNREVRRYAPNCKFIFTVDEKANAETAKKVVECKKTGLIDCFIYNTISSSYMTAVLDSL